MINRLLFIDTDERFDGLPDSLGVILIILEGSFKELELSSSQWKNCFVPSSFVTFPVGRSFFYLFAIFRSLSRDDRTI